MDSILKKNPRRDQRVRVKGTCGVRTSNHPTQLLAQLYDLAMGGMSFYVRQPVFVERGLVDIEFPNVGGSPFRIKGLVVKTPEKTEEGHYKVAVMFEFKLSVTQFAKLLQVCDYGHEDAA